MQSIRNNILKQATLSIFLVVAISFLAIDLVVTDWLDSEFDYRLKNKSGLLITITKYLDEGVDFDFADEFMPEFLALLKQDVDDVDLEQEFLPLHLEDEIRQEYFEVRFADGDILETSYSLVADHLPIIDTNSEVAFKDLYLPDKSKARMIQVKFKPQIPSDDRRIPEIIDTVPDMVMSVAISTAELDRTKNIMHFSLGLLTLISLFLLYTLIDKSVRQGLKPLKLLEKELHNLEANNLSQRVNAGKDLKETSSVVAQVNELLERLDSSIQREKRFSSNVSHELRTPVSEIRALADVAAKWPEDKNLTKKSLLEIREASVHMEDLIAQLLQLAKAESADLSLVYAPVIIEDCIHPILNKFSEKINSRGLSISQSYVNGQQCSASVEHLKIILTNLLHNAIKYASNNSSIEISTRIQEQNSILTISNQVDNFTQSDIESMFERFWMKDQVRSKTHSSGIGLSLCKALCESLGYQLEAQLNERTIPMRLSMSLLITNCKDS